LHFMLFIPRSRVKFFVQRAALNSKFVLLRAKILRKTCPSYHLHVPKPKIMLNRLFNYSFNYLKNSNVLTLKTLFCAFLLLASSAIYAQGSGRNTNFNYLDFANKPYYFGITLGLNNADFRIIQSERFLLHDSIKGVTPRLGVGFNLGIVTNLNVGKYFDFRVLPTLSFTDRKLEYRMLNNAIVSRNIESVYVELPFQVRYKSAPYHDVRLFIIGGMKYSFDVASNSRARQAEKLIKVAPSDFSVEYGAGFQVFMPYFIFSPEFKVSQGIGNIMVFDTNLQQASVIEQLYSRLFTISFHFEG
jgi:Outer membrane protein beta-barrel domain